MVCSPFSLCHYALCPIPGTCKSHRFPTQPCMNQYLNPMKVDPNAQRLSLSAFPRFATPVVISHLSHLAQYYTENQTFYLSTSLKLDTACTPQLAYSSQLRLHINTGGSSRKCCGDANAAQIISCTGQYNHILRSFVSFACTTCKSYYGCPGA